MCETDLVCLWEPEYQAAASVRETDLVCLWEPEYQAAASVVLMTASTGTRSATALLDALMVRRIPFPAYTGQRSARFITR